MNTEAAHWTFLVGNGDIADALRAFNNIESDVTPVTAGVRQTISARAVRGGGNFMVLDIPADVYSDGGSERYVYDRPSVTADGRNV